MVVFARCTVWVLQVVHTPCMGRCDTHISLPRQHTAASPLDGIAGILLRRLLRPTAAGMLGQVRASGGCTCSRE